MILLKDETSSSIMKINENSMIDIRNIHNLVALKRKIMDSQSCRILIVNDYTAHPNINS